jgi:polar amino acid transport system substrate-binding protein
MNKVAGWKSCAVTLALCAASLGAHADDLANVHKAGELVVGTEMQFAPFDFLENGQQAGFNKDLFVEIGKELGVKVRFIDLPWPSVLPGLEAHKFDMVGGPLTVTKARADRYAYTLPIADATDALLKRTGDTSLKQASDIAGKTVGAGKSTAQYEQLKVWAATLPKPPEIREYVDFNQAYSDRRPHRRCGELGDQYRLCRQTAARYVRSHATVVRREGVLRLLHAQGRRQQDAA